MNLYLAWNVYVQKLKKKTVQKLMIYFTSRKEKLMGKG